jgi:hypothetical protein
MTAFLMAFFEIASSKLPPLMAVADQAAGYAVDDVGL